MSESATRDVIFRMQARPAPDALQNAHKFGQSLERIQLRTLNIVDKRREESAQAVSRFAVATLATEQATLQKAGQAFDKFTAAKMQLRRQDASFASELRRQEAAAEDRTHAIRLARQRELAQVSRGGQVTEPVSPITRAVDVRVPAVDRAAAISPSPGSNAPVELPNRLPQQASATRPTVSVPQMATAQATAPVSTASIPTAGAIDDKQTFAGLTQSLREYQQAAQQAHRIATQSIEKETQASKPLSAEIVNRLDLRIRELRLTRQTSQPGVSVVALRPDDSGSAIDQAAAAERAKQDAIRQTSQSRLDAAKVTDRTSQQEAQATAKAAQLTEREEDRLHKRHRERQRSVAAQNRKTRNDEAKEQAKAVQLTEQQMAQAQGRLQAGGNLLRSGIADAGGELIKVGTGLATIGLVSEKNNEKLLRGLVLLRGANDIVSGGLKLWEKTSAIVEAYRATLAASKTIQATLLAQQALMGAAGAGGAAGAARGVANVAGGVAGNAAGGAAGVAGMSMLQKAAIPVGAALGKVTTAASLLAAPLAKVGAIAGAAAMGLDMLYSAATTGSTKSREGSTREAAEQKVGGVIASVGAWRASGKTDDELKEQVKTGGATAAQFAQTELSRRAAEKLAKTGQQQAEMRENREALIAEQEVEKQDARNLATLKMDAYDAQSKAELQPFLSEIQTGHGDSKVIKKADDTILNATQAISIQQQIIEQQQQAIADATQKNLTGVELAKETIKATRAIEKAQQEITDRQNAIQASVVAKVESRSNIIAIDEAMNKATQQRNGLGAMNVGNDPASLAQKENRLAAYDEQLVTLAKDRREQESAILAAKHQQAKVGLEGSRRELENTQATLQATKDRISVLRQSLLTAKERFGQMDNADQMKILTTAEKAREGGRLDKTERQTLIDNGFGDLRELAGEQARKAADELKTIKGGTYESLIAASTRQELKMQEEEAKRLSEIQRATQYQINVQEKLIVQRDLTAEEVATIVGKDSEKHLEQVQKMLEADARSREIERSEFFDMLKKKGRSLNFG